MTQNFLKIRQQLIDKQVMKEKGDYFEFPEDYIFTSPSTAAAMILGRNANGLTEWRLPSGMTLKEFESTDKNNGA